ncbi:MAG: hypothetical protein U0166_02900 [Acidobacteriota bacterium]
MAIDIDKMVELFDRAEVKESRRGRKGSREEDEPMGKVLPFRKPRQKGPSGCVAVADEDDGDTAA